MDSANTILLVLLCCVSVLVVAVAVLNLRDIAWSKPESMLGPASGVFWTALEGLQSIRQSIQAQSMVGSMMVASADVALSGFLTLGL